MRQVATVIENNGDYAVVEVKRVPACDACEQNGACPACGKLVRLKVKNSIGASAGERVILEAPSGHVLAYAAAVFVLPIITAFAIWGILDASGFGQAVTIGSACAAFAVVFTAMCVILDRRAKAKPESQIVGRCGDNQNYGL